MKNKVIAIILSITLIFSLSANVYAASITDKIGEFSGLIEENTKTTVKSLITISELSLSLAKKAQNLVLDFALDSENWEKAADTMMKYIVKIYDSAFGDNPEKPESPDLPETPDVPGFTELISELTIGDFVELIKKYFFININDIPATSEDIIKNAEYTYTLIEDGMETIFIAVKIEEHPELLNRALLMEAAEKLYNEQKLLFPEISEDLLMSYEHIAGELALHAILYAITNEYLAITGATEGMIFELWERARIADLNITEARIPIEIIRIAGTYIMGVFIVDFYTLLKIFS